MARAVITAQSLNARAVKTALICTKLLKLDDPRVAWMKTTPGGWGGLTRLLLHQMFVVDKVATKGINLVLNGRRVVVVVTFAYIIGDDEAISFMWSTKGASGLCPCGLRCSVVNKQCNSDVDAGIMSLVSRDGEIGDLTTYDTSKLGIRTDADVWQMWDALESRRGIDLAWWQHVVGFKWCSHAILQEKALRPYVAPSKTRIDPMHVLVSNGLMGAELKFVLDEIKAYAGTYFKDVREWQSREQWLPRCELFSEARERSATNHIKAGAADVLYGYPLLRWFIINHFGEDPPECFLKSFMRLSDICDIYRWLKQGGDKELSRPMRKHVSAYMEAFRNSYGDFAFRFKHHELVHLPDEFWRDLETLNWLVDCFVLERKHIEAKNAMQNTKSLKAIANAALSRMLCSQLRKLEKPGWHNCLLGKTQPFPEMAAQFGAASVTIARGMRWNGMPLSNGKAMFFNSSWSSMLLVVACVTIDDEWAVLGREGLKQHTSDRTGQYFSRWKFEQKVLACRRLKDGDRVFMAAFQRRVSPDCMEVLH